MRKAGQRGYLLTSDLSYLKPFDAAVTSLHKHLADLKASAADYPAHLQLVEQLEALTQQKLRELTKPLPCARPVTAWARWRWCKAVRASRSWTSCARWRRACARSRTCSWRPAASSGWPRPPTPTLFRRRFAGPAGADLHFGQRDGAGIPGQAQQSWVSTGLTGLGQRIHGGHRLEEIGQIALEYLAGYLRAQVGAGYVVTGRRGFALFGGYALPRERLAETLLVGEGLVGQAARSRELMHVRDVPAGLPAGVVQHGAGQRRRAAGRARREKHGQVYAVIELGFQPPGDRDRAHADGARLGMLAVAIRSGIDRNRLQNLLERPSASPKSCRPSKKNCA